MHAQEKCDGTIALRQQNFQTTSQFTNEEFVPTMPLTIQQSISPIHPTYTTPHNEHTPFQQSELQSTAEPTTPSNPSIY